ncbi:MAG: LamG domain-containing protein [Candidatus Nanohaloarchaea archaeon]|nr:LamG domain-containing protein [Candidatus Nanohaloarchaea archaeon]
MRVARWLRRSQEARLFLTVFLIFVLFSHWGGINSDSRYFLTRAMVEDGTVEITPYERKVWDKRITGVDRDRYFGNLTLHPTPAGQAERLTAALANASQSPEAVIYSDRAPLTSILSIPGYIAGDIVAEALSLSHAEVWIDQGIGSIPYRVSPETAVKQFLMVVSVPVLFGSMLLVMLFRDLRKEVDERTAYITVAVVGGATFVLYYATALFGVITAAALGYASLSIVRNGGGRPAALYLGGVLAGLAVATEYYAAIVPAAIAVYVISRRQYDDVLRYAAGTVLGTVPLLLYNYAATGNPFSILFFHGISPMTATPGPCTIYSACYQQTGIFLGMVADPVRAVNAAIRLLVSPVRGLLFYSPVLLVALPGVRELWRQDRRQAILFPGIFALLFLFQSVQLNWLAGGSFGPRYAVVGLPFLALPLALGIKQVMQRGTVWRAALAVLVAVSAFNMVLGLNGVPGPHMTNAAYEERFNSLQPVQDGVYTELLDKFDRYGVRSEVMMSSLGRQHGFGLRRFGVEEMPPYGPSHIGLVLAAGNFLLLGTALLPLLLTLLVLAAVWPRVRRHPAAIAAGALLLAASLSIQPAYIASDTYRSYDAGPAISDGHAVVHAAPGMPVIEFEKILDTDTVPLRISMNGVEREYKITSRTETVFLPLHRSVPGRNRIEINVTMPCRVPAFTTDSSDRRCYSLAIRDVRVARQHGSSDVAGLWRFNGALDDSSGHGTDGMARGDPRFTDGFNGAGISLDGEGDHVVLPYGPNFHFPGNLSLEAWVYPRSSSTLGQIISRADVAEEEGYRLGVTADRKVVFGVGNGSSWQRLYSPAPLQAGEWHHVAAVKEGDTLSLYVDGTGIGHRETIQGAVADPEVPLRIGRASYDGEYFNGIIDEARVVAAARTPATFHYPDGGRTD